MVPAMKYAFSLGLDCIADRNHDCVYGRLGLDRLQSAVNHEHDVTASSSLSQSECPIRNHGAAIPDAESDTGFTRYRG